MTLSALQRQLAHVRAHPEIRWIDGIENVPVWPGRHPLTGRLSAARYAARYEDPRGEPLLIDAVLQRERDRGKSVEGSGVCITHGGLAGLGLVFRHLRSSGLRTLICQMPMLSSIHLLAVSAGLSVRGVGSDEFLDYMANDASRDAALYLCSPHNPTGAVWDEAEIKTLMSGRADNFRLVVDGVYDSFVFGERPCFGYLEDPRIFYIDSMSKSYGSPGLRVGWVVGAPDEVDRLVVRNEFENIAVGGLNQELARRLLEHGNVALIDRVVDGRRQVIRWWSRLNAAGAAEGQLSVDGGTQACVPLPVGLDVELLSHRLLTDFHLVLVSSANYHNVPGAAPFLRVPLGCDPQRLCQILEALEPAIVSQYGDSRLTLM
ncbi:aminotransferase class I/II-fold pyridoxal phosphate-dependent enzyme [Actinoplanes palleronii]|uniref:aminotransferase class I/II-fold pyridoxal phosphate-dependent enzyme n=1 Tax=Actinoplanes palleronii TaxID=113570 RepID=UPI00194526AF|nr:aminotransferase class I/II-fold pyridoxal phosphate-dependent enzyme [Actinoplanes palleronii]